VSGLLTDFFIAAKVWKIKFIENQSDRMPCLNNQINRGLIEWAEIKKVSSPFKKNPPFHGCYLILPIA
jgi:hypothetical protein